MLGGAVEPLPSKGHVTLGCRLSNARRPPCRRAWPSRPASVTSPAPRDHRRWASPARKP
jgi:hypothetical protein